MNQFGDLTSDEYRYYILGHGRPSHSLDTDHGGSFLLPPDVTSLPPSIDWRKKGYVTPVKNQGILYQNYNCLIRLVVLYIYIFLYSYIR